MMILRDFNLKFLTKFFISYIFFFIFLNYGGSYILKITIFSFQFIIFLILSLDFNIYSEDMSISIYYFNYIHHKDNGFSNINLIILKFIISYIFFY